MDDRLTCFSPRPSPPPGAVYVLLSSLSFRSSGRKIIVCLRCPGNRNPRNRVSISSFTRSRNTCDRSIPPFLKPPSAALPPHRECIFIAHSVTYPFLFLGPHQPAMALRRSRTRSVCIRDCTKLRAAGRYHHRRRPGRVRGLGCPCRTNCAPSPNPEWERRRYPRSTPFIHL